MSSLAPKWDLGNNSTSGKGVSIRHHDSVASGFRDRQSDTETREEEKGGVRWGKGREAERKGNGGKGVERGGNGGKEERDGKTGVGRGLMEEVRGGRNQTRNRRRGLEHQGGVK